MSTGTAGSVAFGPDLPDGVHHDRLVRLELDLVALGALRGGRPRNSLTSVSPPWPTATSPWVFCPAVVRETGVVIVAPVPPVEKFTLPDLRSAMVPGRLVPGSTVPPSMVMRLSWRMRYTIPVLRRIAACAPEPVRTRSPWLSAICLVAGLHSSFPSGFTQTFPSNSSKVAADAAGAALASTVGGGVGGGLLLQYQYPRPAARARTTPTAT